MALPKDCFPVTDATPGGMLNSEPYLIEKNLSTRNRP